MRFHVKCFMLFVFLFTLFAMQVLVLAQDVAPEATTLPSESKEEVEKEVVRLEKTLVRLGFMKLVDAAPLIIAYEKGFFKAEGLQVRLYAQSNWKYLMDRVTSGELDGAHMMAPLAITKPAGVDRWAEMIVPMSMSRNGGAITVSRDTWKKMLAEDAGIQQAQLKGPLMASTIKPVVDQATDTGRPLRFGMSFPFATDHYMLRYWLAAAEIHPGRYTKLNATGTVGASVSISMVPPPQMPATMQAGVLAGYSVSAPWNQQAMFRAIGVPVVTSYDIRKNASDKVFGLTKEWAEKNPNTTIALVKAMILAAQWLDEKDEQGQYLNRKEAAKILSQPKYVGTDEKVLVDVLMGRFAQPRWKFRELPEYLAFFQTHASYPYYSDAVWYLTQMRRWGQIDEAKSNDWYHDSAKKVYQPEIYLAAAKALLKEGKIKPSDIPWKSDGYLPVSKDFIDQVEFDPRKPVEYVRKLKFSVGKDDPLE